MDFIRSGIGERGFIILIWLILAVSGLVFLICTIINYPGLIRVLIVVLLLIVGLLFIWCIKIPEEKIHILEYGFLGWLAARDLIAKDRKIKGVILACALTLLFGVLDEVFQAALPYRYFDLRDIGLNSLGGIWGIVLYLLGIASVKDYSASGKK